MVGWSALFWMGLVASLPPHVARWVETRPSAASRLGVGLPMLAFLLSVAMAPTHLAYVAKQRTRLRVLEDAALAMLSGVRSDQIYKRLTFVSAHPARGAHEVQARDGRGPFAARRAGLPGRPLPLDLEAAPYSRCAGSATLLERLPADGAPAGRVAGRVRDLLLGSPPEAILILDHAGIVRGLGSTEAGLGGGAWRGYVTPLEAGGYEVMAMLPDRRVCSIGPLTVEASQ
jgi:hypothetical protein